MKQLMVIGSSGQSRIAVGESIANLPAHYGKHAPAIVITDRTVHAIHGHRFPECPTIEIGMGEESKTLVTIEKIYETFLQYELDRSSLVLAIGGGIVCDVAGFAASTYLRGLSFGFVPTTLLAQVDASVGGKNGVNLRGYKNLIGTFSQPSFVLCDPELLLTLPREELINGYAEVIKQAAIADADFFAFLEVNVSAALALAPSVVEHAVYESLRIKTAIVSLDEKEAGERRKLNFGHTVGHGVEKAHHLRHGEAVSIGMVAATRLSVAKGLLSEQDARRMEDLLVHFGLPARMPIDIPSVLDAIRKDKKREDDLVQFVLLDAIGRSRIVPITIHEMEGVLNDLCEPR